jgi:dolichyl-phosphate beta-glucosyltransferase
MPSPALSVVIPAYNEAGRLPDALALLAGGLDGQGPSFELILVDDGSTDGTLEIMRRAERDQPNVRVVALTPNRGKGRALAEGVKVSRGDLVLISDTDFSTPIQELGKLCAALEAGADVAIASRALRGSTIEVSQPVHRVLMGKTFNLMVQALVLPGIWDTQCGFKLFRGPVARELFGQLRTEGFAFDVEVLYRARRAGYSVAEIPVRWAHSAPTRLSSLRHSAQMFRDLLRIRLGR